MQIFKWFETDNSKNYFSVNRKKKKKVLSDYVPEQ